MHKKKIVLLVISIIVIIFLGSGQLLDRKAESVIDKSYLRDAQGIAYPMQSIEHRNSNNKEAVVFIHGFESSPAIFSATINNIKDRLNKDIYAPLLPFHGRNLKTISKMNIQILSSYLENYLHNLSKQYDHISIIGHSMGGALLSSLAINDVLPKNIQIILYAPAFFIPTNTRIMRLQIYGYALWRNYCDYTSLGCHQPNHKLNNQRTTAEPHFRYITVPAVFELHKLDLQYRSQMHRLKKPYTVIVAKDDHRVSSVQLQKICELNKNFCTWYQFETGGHKLHLSENKKAFEDLLIQNISQPITRSQ